MHSLRMLGGIGLTDSDGREIDALLRQPKHVALLVYLALPEPGTWHRRDSILGVLWGDHEQTRARSALRSALYTLRGHLPEGMIRSRGQDEISLNPAMIITDLAAMRDDLEGGRDSDALARYRGELLPGLYISEGSEFEKWLGSERKRANALARQSASKLADRLERVGDITGAIGAARRAAELDPDDEAAARRWIALLDRAGDRAQAFAVYEKFRNHMADAFGVRPSAETVALLDKVRTRREAAPEEKRQPTFDTPVLQPDTAISGRNPETLPPAAAMSAPARRRWLLLALPAFAALLLWAVLSPRRAATATAAPGALVVLPMVNATGDPDLAYIATGIADGIAQRLGGTGGVTIRSIARSDWNDSSQRGIESLRREFGAGLFLRSSIRKDGDSLEVRASVHDLATSEQRTLATHRFTTQGIKGAEERLAADVAGAVFRVPIPTRPRTAGAVVDAESYRLTLEGWHQLFLRPAGGNIAQRHIAAALFSKAIDRDPLNARAWSGLSSVWASLVVIGAVPYEEGTVRATAAADRALAIDSLQGTALANLAIMRAYLDRDIRRAIPLIKKAVAAEPSNPEVFMIRSLIERSAHLYDEARHSARVAHQLDPLSPFYLNHWISGELCADRPEAALELYRSELTLNPSSTDARTGMARSLALLGRYDEAIETWRVAALSSGNTTLAQSLETAKGREGYWRVSHNEGRKRLATLLSRPDRPSPLSITLAHLAAGDSARGFDQLQRIDPSVTPPLYRLSCNASVDEYRGTPRYRAALRRIGALRTR